jgi:hypothetical protein
VYADELLRPWFAAVREEPDGVKVFDCHTHVGINDPTGFSAGWDLIGAAALLARTPAAPVPVRATAEAQR